MVAFLSLKRKQDNAWETFQDIQTSHTSAITIWSKHNTLQARTNVIPLLKRNLHPFIHLPIYLLDFVGRKSRHWVTRLRSAGNTFIYQAISSKRMKGLKIGRNKDLWWCATLEKLSGNVGKVITRKMFPFFYHYYYYFLQVSKHRSVCIEKELRKKGIESDKKLNLTCLG